MANNQMQGNQVIPQQVLASSFGAKCSTKGEVWRFLTTEAKIYLPSFQTVTIWHVSLMFFLNPSIAQGPCVR